MSDANTSITRHKDLRAGRSVWMARRLSRPTESPFGRGLETDVLVVGAGISGAMVADSLTDAGLDVTIVDRRGALQGSTPASTALLQYEIDTPLSDLAKDIGRERAERIWRRSKLALDALRERARALEIDADLVNRDSLYLQGNVLDAAGLRTEAEARRRAGFEATFMEPRDVKKRFDITGRAAILGYDNLSADPRRLAAGFLEAAIARGARLLAPVDIAEVTPRKTGVTATDVNGAAIRARAIVFATGYELVKGVPKKSHSIASTWALATKPQPRKLWPEQCFIWEASDPYLYLRTTLDGRVVCGGEDEEFSDEAKRDALMDKKIAAIQKKLAKLMPQLDVTAEFAWCGNFGASDTGTPSIGPVPRMPHCYAVMGYGGNGITFSMMAAQMLRGMIAGDGDPDADLFSFTRKF
jgi:glycine/D-amino acid oxidase-like deaminating enzyme